MFEAQSPPAAAALEAARFAGVTDQDAVHGFGAGSPWPRVASFERGLPALPHGRQPGQGRETRRAWSRTAETDRLPARKEDTEEKSGVQVQKAQPLQRLGFEAIEPLFIFLL